MPEKAFLRRALLTLRRFFLYNKGNKAVRRMEVLK